MTIERIKRRSIGHTERLVLSEIQANPYHDLRIDPLDEKQVEAWQRIFAKHGFLAGNIIGRRVGDDIELIAGEAWVEALRELGHDNVDVELVDCDNVEAVRLHHHFDVYLNAGGSASGILGTVAMAF